ncbi:MAG: LPS export ABC transporter permease LptF [Gammaproteobacteria bacterium]|nr:LPS export ABC transporter permease LptF [Gammaproteobacteria bacterium]
MFRIIDRYLLREAIGAWFAVTAVLLVIIIAHRFARFLGEAASGNLPGPAVFELLGYACIGFLTVLTPVGLFIGLLTAFGRLYRDSEMVAMFACGVGVRDVYRPVLVLGLAGALLVAWLNLFASPWAASEALKSRRIAEKQAELGVFESGRFKTSKDGDVAFYAESADSDTGILSRVFVAARKTDGESVAIRAAEGEQVRSEATGQRFLVLNDGRRYDGVIGDANYRTYSFAEHGIQIRQDDPDFRTFKRDGVPTVQLLISDSPRDIAELHWRISGPVMTLLLVFIAVPLAQTRPREGRYGRVVIGVLLYVVYSNLLGVAQVWLEKGRLSPDTGLWPVHLLALLVGFVLLAKMTHWNLARLWPRGRSNGEAAA